MPADEIDAYLARLEEPKRSTLQALRTTILSVIPEAAQGMSYAAPVFRIEGRAVAGFSAARRHLSYLPHSGSVISSVDPELLAGYEVTKGAVKFPVDATLPQSVVEALITSRLQELGLS